MKRVGILTGGGDCPGLNAVIRAVARRSFGRGYEVVGVRNGWRGLVDADTTALTIREVSGLLPRGGTVIGTSRTNPYKVDGGVDDVRRNFAEAGLDALVVIGGEDTLGVAAVSTPSTSCPWSASRRRSTTTSRRRTTPSASTLRSRSVPRRSTGCTRPPSRTTA